MKQPATGFTLIELSIVLVIIGLIAGGVLVGRDLISAATVRAQISQIERYQQAVGTFRGKYGYLPGDIPDPDATRFGFVGRGGAPGTGDGNGAIQGSGPNGAAQGGEVLTFWVDLTKARFIDGTFYTANPTMFQGALSPLTLYYPTGRIGNNNYVYVYNGGYFDYTAWAWVSDGYNYFGLSSIAAVNAEIYSTTGLTVQQAYAIDTKMDDGLPQSGSVMARYLNYNLSIYGPLWAGGTAVGAAPGAVAAGTATTCYDNNGSTSNRMNYSVTQNNGSGINCALSFRFR